MCIRDRRKGDCFMKKNDYLEELKEMAGEFDDEPKSCLLYTSRCV